jgi:glycosyltransferase involved in cell wall biosynthesis
MLAADRRCVALLTGGGDRPYAIGLSSALIDEGIPIDFIGSDDLEHPILMSHSLVTFLNLRGDCDPRAPKWWKVWRILRYYLRLVRYAVLAKPRLFHVLWNNKFELFDRTLLLLFYRLLGKRLVLTVHNVNMSRRDGHDSALNRLTLRIQYHLADHLFVHTPKMQRELETDFGVPSTRVTVIPLGINNAVPVTSLSGEQARARLGLSAGERVILFFGSILPYKGVDFLVDAVATLNGQGMPCRLVIAGRPKGGEQYWQTVEQQISRLGLDHLVVKAIQFVPDEETEVYFKAADVVALPYSHVFQSGVLVLGYSFGLPVIASDVGSLRDEIVEGRTGFVCAPSDPGALANSLAQFFSSDLYRSREATGAHIKRFAADRYSWHKVATATRQVYEDLGVGVAPHRAASALHR